MSTETVAQTNEIILRPDENVAFSIITGFNYMYLSISGGGFSSPLSAPCCVEQDPGSARTLMQGPRPVMTKLPCDTEASEDTLYYVRCLRHMEYRLGNKILNMAVAISTQTQHLLTYWIVRSGLRFWCLGT